MGEAPPDAGAAAPVSDGEVAAFVAARAFLAAEWFGALLLVASFTQLYVAVGSGLYLGAVAVVLGLGLAAVGGFVFLRSRRYYARLGVPFRPRWHAAAAVVAGAGAVFWLLFVFLAALAWFGYPLLSD